MCFQYLVLDMSLAHGIDESKTPLFHLHVLVFSLHHNSELSLTKGSTIEAIHDFCQMWSWCNFLSIYLFWFEWDDSNNWCSFLFHWFLININLFFVLSLCDNFNMNSTCDKRLEESNFIYWIILVWHWLRLDANLQFKDLDTCNHRALLF